MGYINAVTRTFLGSIAALFAGLCIFQIEIAFRMLGFWRGSIPVYFDWATHFIILGAIYLAVPLLALIAASILWKGHLSLAACCGVPVIWSGFVLLWWAYKPWAYYGEFPWWMLKRDLVPACGAALTTGWVYWRFAKVACVRHHSTRPARKAAQAG